MFCGELNDFSVDIIGNNVRNFIRNSTYFYAMPNKTVYSIKLGNGTSVRCDATVHVDGDIVGTWRINQHSSIIIKRPAKINREFIFVSENSEEAHNTGMCKGSFNNGLIKVVFKPEAMLSYQYRSSLPSYKCSRSYDSFGMTKGDTRLGFDDEKGGTILGGNSGQEFGVTSKICCYGPETIINLRLIIDTGRTESSPEYVSIHEGRTEEPIGISHFPWDACPHCSHQCPHCSHHCYHQCSHCCSHQCQHHMA
jgi:hypothetical protein